jgi:plastocyanin
MRLDLLAIPALLATLALAACGSSSSSGESGTTAPAGGGQTISIGESEFKLDPSSVKVDRAGAVTFKVTNNGSIDHSLEVEGQGVEEETETIEPGETAELTVDLSREGSYEIYCPIDGHRDSGMEGTLTVGAASMGAGTDTSEKEGSTTDDNDGSGYGG